VLFQIFNLFLFVDVLSIFRIWNSQFISYAGFKQMDGTILGDAGQIEFTEVSIKYNQNQKDLYT
jgi:nitric oxide synthase oxygenase domain/subunit